MPTVFLSYSRKDHFFAELADIKLTAAGISLWKDHGQLRAGEDWRQGIEKGIADCPAVLPALSEHSSKSSYVTFEWAYALGNRKVVIPVKLDDCVIPPRLEVVQYLDFSVPGALPWESLINRIREIERPTESLGADAIHPEAPPPQANPLAKAVLAYLDQWGYQMASFDRLRQRIDKDVTDKMFSDLIDEYPTVFRRARLAGGRPGIAKVIP